MKASILKVKSYAFAIRIVKLSQYLKQEKVKSVLTIQILKSGTAIGASIWEAEFSQSKADFIHKMSIALKEANETSYWLSIFKDTALIGQAAAHSLQKDCQEIIALLVSSIKTAKKNNGK